MSSGPDKGDEQGHSIRNNRESEAGRRAAVYAQLTWSLEGICGWKLDAGIESATSEVEHSRTSDGETDEDSAVVYPVLELRVLWATQREMPVEDVGLVRLGVDAVGASGQLLGFLQEPLDGRGAG